MNKEKYLDILSDEENENVLIQLEAVGIFDFSVTDVLDMLCNGFEGGIGYWCCFDNCTSEYILMSKQYPDDTIEETMMRVWANDLPLVFIDTEEDKRHYLYLGDFIDGIKMTFEHTDWDGDMWEADSITGDCVFQYAMFGDVIYG